MSGNSNTWALVLAAGDGTRLRSLTTAASGLTVPKQFCSLYAGPSLLHEALRRAHAVTAEDRTCVIVAEQHRRWWQGALRRLPGENVIVQAHNRGTGLGILLPLMQILARDPQARLVLLPSDHHVRQEALLIRALEQALRQLEWRDHETLLLGVRPEELDPDLGYIVPGCDDDLGAFRVERFVEKPSAAVAGELIRAGGLWNTFIIAATGRALLELFRRRFPEIVSILSAALDQDRRTGSAGDAVAGLYERLPSVDFSEDILAEQVADLRVLPVPPCGWSDLGTPKRVSDALRRTPRPEVSPVVHPGIGYLSLADQQLRLRSAPGVGGTI